MGLVRVKNKIGIANKVCPICYRTSPVTDMVKVEDFNTNKTSYVCRFPSFVNSCEAKFYSSSDMDKKVKELYKNFSW